MLCLSENPREVRVKCNKKFNPCVSKYLNILEWQKICFKTSLFFLVLSPRQIWCPPVLTLRLQPWCNTLLNGCFRLSCPHRGEVIEVIEADSGKRPPSLWHSHAYVLFNIVQILLIFLRKVYLLWGHNLFITVVKINRVCLIRIVTGVKSETEYGITALYASYVQCLHSVTSSIRHRKECIFFIVVIL